MSIAVRDKDLDQDLILGYLEFHSIGALRIHKEKLAEIFDKHALDRKFMPGEIKPHDAYRRATKRAESQIDIDDNGRKEKARLLVREVKSDANMVVRHLVREIVDSKNEVLDYATVGKFILSKQNGTMDVSWDSAYVSEYPYDVLLKDIKDLFIDWTQYHTRDTVNNIIRRIINSMNHISVMPNGKATFIPKTQRLTLEGLQGLIKDLSPYQLDQSESVIEVIPIIDTLDQRDMVQKRAEYQISAEANQLLADFADLLSREGFDSVKVVKRYAEKVTELQLRVEEYEKIINKKMSVIQNQLMDAVQKIRTTEETLVAKE